MKPSCNKSFLGSIHCHTCTFTFCHPSTSEIPSNKNHSTFIRHLSRQTRPRPNGTSCNLFNQPATTRGRQSERERRNSTMHAAAYSTARSNADPMHSSRVVGCDSSCTASIRAFPWICCSKTHVLYCTVHRWWPRMGCRKNISVKIRWHSFFDFCFRVVIFATTTNPSNNRNETLSGITCTDSSSVASFTGRPCSRSCGLNLMFSATSINVLWIKRF